VIVVGTVEGGLVDVMVGGEGVIAPKVLIKLVVKVVFGMLDFVVASGIAWLVILKRNLNISYS